MVPLVRLPHAAPRHRTEVTLWGPFEGPHQPLTHPSMINRTTRWLLVAAVLVSTACAPALREPVEETRLVVRNETGVALWVDNGARRSRVAIGETSSVPVIRARTFAVRIGGQILHAHIDHSRSCWEWRLTRSQIQRQAGPLPCTR